jgi:AcrR family transcriptional regulator
MSTFDREEANSKIHRRLRKAYVILRHKKEEDEITVSNLVEEADISRAAFYLHYKNLDEFTLEAERYIMALYIDQLLIFLESGRENVKEVCKKRNLILSESERELFKLFFEKHLGFTETRVDFVFKEAYGRTIEKFGANFVKKYKAIFDLFLVGYISSMRVNIFDYHSDKVYRDMIRIFDIWDALFPDEETIN